MDPFKDFPPRPKSRSTMSPAEANADAKAEAATKANNDAIYIPEIFSPEEEKQLLEESNTEKVTANKTFTSGDYTTAIQGYEKALAVCPTYLEYDIAVLRSNISACQLKLEEWKEAVESATKALDALDRIDPPPAKEATENGRGDVVGGVSEIDDSTEILLDALTRTGHNINDVHKLRTKALLRRAKARHEVGGWASLQGSLEDYQALSKPPHQLSSLDQKAVQAAMRTLPTQLNTAKDKEMAEMMGNLKKLGNGILKPFGLSTDNFQFQQDPKTGGYSMNFNQNPGK
jgi:tetratricopeptide (TPR) repeat protein